jgi:hypothetical protein
MCNFLFFNKETKEIRRAASFSLNSAARLADIPVEYRGKLPEPWMPWECWESPTECLWHCTVDGDCHPGKRLDP